MVKQFNKRRGVQGKRSSGTGRSRTLELLWGAQGRSSRGPKPALSVAGITQAAIQIVDAEGLSALTMARVAMQVDVTTMAIYRYVPGKEELIELMIDAAFGSPPAHGGDGWRSELSRWARAELAMFQGRTWLLETVLRRAVMGPNWLSWLNAALEALAGTGLRGSEMTAAVTLVDGHVRAATQMWIGARGKWAENFDRVLRMVKDDPRYAALAHSLGGEPDPRSVEEQIQEHFEFGLERLLDGIETFIQSRAAQRQKNAAPARSRGRKAR